MKFNKKGFSLAEMLIVFLLVSIMLAAFAPVMTKKSKKSSDPNCVGGIKSVEVLYPEAGTYNFAVPENISGTAMITLVGAGGAGGNASVVSIKNETLTTTNAGGRVPDDEIIQTVTTGGGGGAGAYLYFEATLSPEATYQVIVGKGGDSLSPNGSLSSIALSETYTAQGGLGASGSTQGTGGINNTNDSNNSSGGNGFNGGSNVAPGMGAINTIFSSSDNGIMGGIAGGYCPLSSCSPHGKAGSNYDKNGLSAKSFIAGFGGGGGGYDGASRVVGFGGAGGNGFVKIRYDLRCE